MSKKLLILAFLTATISLAADLKHSKFARVLWRVSEVVLVAATTADAASSWGRPEINPVLGHQFGARGIAVKAGLMGGVLALQEFSVRRGMNPKAAAALNFAGAGVFGYAAIHNTRLR